MNKASGTKANPAYEATVVESNNSGPRFGARPTKDKDNLEI